MIEKKIHYCWFGGNPIPESVNKCILSWKKQCPDYEICLWTEDNFDVHINDYMAEAYEAGKWAFVSDIARLIIVYENGGIYLDTDVELIKSLDDIISDNSFFFGIEKDTNVRTGEEFIGLNTGIGFGAEKGSRIIKAMLDEYKGIHFKKEDGTFDLTPCPVRNSKALEKQGVKISNEMIRFEGGTIYPSEYFCPEELSSDIKNYTANTISIHHYSSSWKSGRDKLIFDIRIIVRKILACLKKK